MAITYLDYITEDYWDNSAWVASSKIDTGIIMNDPNITVRIKYKPKYTVHDTWTFCDRICGYMGGDYDSGESGLRIFGYTGGTFDSASGRRSNLNITTPDQLYDLTFDNDSLYDNINQRWLVTSTGTTSIPAPSNSHILVDVNWTYVKELTINNGNTVLFNGLAGKDEQGHIGLYDTVSQTLKYNPDIVMYDPSPTPTPTNIVYPDKWKVGIDTTVKAYSGLNEVKKMYIGDNLVYMEQTKTPPAPPAPAVQAPVITATTGASLFKRYPKVSISNRIGKTFWKGEAIIGIIKKTFDYREWTYANSSPSYAVLLNLFGLSTSFNKAQFWAYNEENGVQSAESTIIWNL